MTAVAVAVNLLWCAPGRVGGSEQYLTRQLLGLDAIDPGRERVAPTVLASRRFHGAHPEIRERFATRAPRLSMDRRPVRIAAEHLWLPLAVRGADVVHHGGGTMPARLPSGRALPTVLTIHDLQYLSHPGYFSQTRLRYLRAVVPRSVVRASVITTPSEYVRHSVVSELGADADRVVVVPHGLPEPVEPAERDEAALRRRYGLDDAPFLVYPAITHPHKNHSVVLRALAAGPAHLRLVLIGGRGAAEDEVSGMISSLGLAERVCRPGRVPDADRDALLATAHALVFPSRYEGFGAPVIEAMAAGTPVITSDHPALVEVGGDAVLRAPVDDVGAWVAAIERLDADRERLVTAGRERARRFSAAESGRALLGAYRLATEVGI